MIRNFTILCKLNFISKTDFKLFQESIDSFSIHSAVCPSCGAKGCLSFHASYQRDLLSIDQCRIFCHSVIIPRVICSSCGHTHAIIPDICIPYGSYSLRFLLTVLRNYFLRQKTVELICSQYQISRSTLYAWRNLFFLHKKLWLGYLSNLTTSSLAFLDDLIDTPQLQDFFHKTGFSFLQSVAITTDYSLP